MDGYVSKPINVRDLSEAISCVIGQAKQSCNSAVLLGSAESPAEPHESDGNTSLQATAPPEHSNGNDTMRPANMVLDEAVALSRIGGNVEQLKLLAETFLVESAKLMAVIRDARTSKDAAKLMQAAHALRGAANVFGARRVASAAFELESMGSAGMPCDTHESSELLEHEVEELTQALSGVIHCRDTELACTN